MVSSHDQLIPCHLLSYAPNPPSQPPLLLLPKSQTNTINTMPLIRRRRIPFPLEHMAQMAPAITAHNLGALHAERAIRMPRHGPRDAVEIRRPAATRFELVRGEVEGRGAGGAAVGARGGGVFVVGAGEGAFGAAGAEDAELFCWILMEGVSCEVL